MLLCCDAILKKDHHIASSPSPLARNAMGLLGHHAIESFVLRYVIHELMVNDSVILISSGILLNVSHMLNMLVCLVCLLESHNNKLYLSVYLCLYNIVSVSAL